MTSERLYTVEDVGELLSLSKQTVYRLVESGHLRTFKTPGRRFRIPHSALEEFVGFELDGEEAAVDATEISTIFGVHEKTVLNWAREGRVRHFKTISSTKGHVRFFISMVLVDLQKSRPYTTYKKDN